MAGKAKSNVLMAAGLVACLVGGFAVLGRIVHASEGDAQATEESGHGKGTSAKKKGNDETSALLVDNLIVPVIRRQRVERHVTLSFILEPNDSVARRKIADAMPRLRNAYMLDLMGYLRIVSLDKESAAVEAIRERLLQITEQTIGPGLVKSLYFQRAGERKL